MKKRNKLNKLKKIEFYRFLKSGLIWKNSIVRIHYYTNNNKHSKIGIIVSKANGSSVKRNKIKRIIRETFRKKIKNSETHLDVLVKICPKIENPDEKYIKEAIETWINGLKK